MASKRYHSNVFEAGLVVCFLVHRSLTMKNRVSGHMAIVQGSPDTAEWVPPFPTWSEMASFEWAKSNMALRDAGYPGFTVSDVTLIHGLAPRERFYVLYNLTQGPLQNLRNRMHRRIHIAQMCDEEDWLFPDETEYECSSDEYSEEVVIHGTGADLPGEQGHDASDDSSDSDMDWQVRLHE